MHIINTQPLKNGIYNDNKNKNIITLPEGWAVIPEDMALPATFPRLGSLEVAEKEYTFTHEEERKNEVTGEMEFVTVETKKTMLTVVSMSEGTMPEPTIPEPTEMERLRADVEFLAIMTGVEL